jgi:hypothetical protein
MLKYIVILGVGAKSIGVFIYIRATIRGVVKPNRITWLIWSIAPLIATAASVSIGARWSVLPVFMSGFGPLLVFLASFANPESYWKLKNFDYACGVCSILALALWAVTGEPLVAVILAIASDGLAALPTVIKAWKHPETESAKAYAAGLFSALTCFTALKTFSITEVAFPIYLVFVTSILLFASCELPGKIKNLI